MQDHEHQVEVEKDFIDSVLISLVTLSESVQEHGLTLALFPFGSMSIIDLRLCSLNHQACALSNQRH